MEILIPAGLAAFISGMFGFITVCINRMWKKKDERESGNTAIINKLNRIEASLNQHIADDALASAKQARTKILRFNDEVKEGKKHTEEHWIEILEDMDIYESYCKENPDYPNNRAEMAITNLKAVYQNCLTKNNFL